MLNQMLPYVMSVSCAKSTNEFDSSVVSFGLFDRSLQVHNVHISTHTD